VFLNPVQTFGASVVCEKFHEFGSLNAQNKGSRTEPEEKTPALENFALKS
jgi:hypothetical protein